MLPQRLEVLRQNLSRTIVYTSNDLAGMARMVLQKAQKHWRGLDAQIKWCDQRIIDHQKVDKQVYRAAQLMGVAPSQPLLWLPR